MARKSADEIGINMTPMIDIVFQMIIFFVVTTDLEKKSFDEKIILALSPSGPAIEKQDPREVVVEVDAKGRISIGRTPLSDTMLTSILIHTVNQYGSSIPVQIRGDRRTEHEYIRRVMESCGRAGLWRVSFVATKEKAGKK